MEYDDLDRQCFPCYGVGEKIGVAMRTIRRGKRRNNHERNYYGSGPY
jgi:hypothetical protein